MNNTTLRDMFIDMGYDPSKMEINEPIDVSDLGYQIESYDIKTKSNAMKLITNIIKKEPSTTFKVKTNSNEFHCSGDHMVAVVDSNKDVTWQPVRRLYKLDDVKVLENGVPTEIAVEKTGKVEEILDIEVEDTHCYYTDNVLSHNSMFGPDMDTTGGKAWEYACSIRVKMKKGKIISEKREGIPNPVPIGISGSLKVIKNRIRSPFAEAEFNIFYDKGIDPLSGLVDVLIQEGVVEPKRKDDGKVAQGWYTYKDENFRRAEFDKVIEKYPELLGGHSLLDLPEHFDIEEDGDSGEEAEM